MPVDLRFPHQARLLLKARVTLGVSQMAMGRILGLNPRPGSAFVSSVEKGRCGLPAHRWRFLHGVISREQALDAYLADQAGIWEGEYGPEG